MTAPTAPDRFTLPLGPFREFVSIEYDYASSQENTEIDAELLAVSIQGFCAITKKVAKEALGLDINVNISANKEGCFEVVATIVGTVSLVGGTLGILQWFGIDYIKTKHIISKLILRNFETINEQLKISDGDVETLLKQINDNKALSDAEKTFLTKLILDRKFQAALEEFTRILSHEEISDISLKHDKEKVIQINKEARNSYVLINPEETTVTHKTYNVKIIYLSPTETVWQFRANKHLFWADVEDLTFLNETKDKDISTLKDTIYTASVKIISTRKRGALRASVQNYITSISVDSSNLFNIPA